MADQRLTDRSALAETPADGDLIHVVDVSDTTDSADGTSKKVAYSNVKYTHPNHSGDVTSTGDGATTIASNAVTTSKILDKNVTLAKVEDIATARILGRTTAGAGVTEQLDASAVRGLLNVADGATANTGDVIGPATNTDNKVPQWNGADNKTLKDGLTVGTGENNLVQLDGDAKLPAVDGSALTNLPSGFSDPMTTRGDMIIRGASATTRLAKGTNGQVLKMGAEEPAWAAEYSYTLPTATDSVKGGVKVGSGLSISSEVLSADTPTDVHITAAPGSDHTASGMKITLTANENQAFGDVGYINADGEVQLADADAIATGKVMAMAVATIAGDASGTYLLQGIARDDTWNWTVGGYVYLSTTGTTGNTLTQTAPSGEDDCVVIVGIATHADRIYFNPQLVIVEYKA